MQERADAVHQTIEKVRHIAQQGTVDRGALEAIGQTLLALARRNELFPRGEFSVPDGQSSRLYRLAEDSDHSFTLYASAGRLGRSTPPHNHTTWAAIAGVYGQERNLFFERIDDRSQPGQGKLRRSGEITVDNTNVVTYLPDDFHAIEVVGNQDGLHLHLYGRSLEHLPDRIAFKSHEGGAYETFPPNPSIGTVAIAAAQLKSLLNDGEEVALLDVREEGDFSRGHLLYASSLPLSRLELAADAMVPRRTTRVIVVDGDGGSLAQRAARRLFDSGWRNIAVLKGGVAAWRETGYEIFTGVNVPSKAFGEFVEHEYGTPHIDASELQQRINSGEKVLILDSRTAAEFEAMSIPGALSCPGAELVYRAQDLIDSPQTLVVVNCAGRTRSIIGAQSLINAGIENRVVALKNGTMGWHLAGLELARGATAAAPRPSPEGLARARAAAARVARRFGVRHISEDELGRFEAETDRHSLYRLDVRTPQEYRAGHLKGWRSAPGGQLVQATDRYVGTLRSRIVVGDDDGVRAVLTASWLIQMGWENVFAIELRLDGGALETGPEPIRIVGESAAVKTIDAQALRELLDRGEAVVVDLATSLEYRDGHIAGAWWAIRSRLDEALRRLPRTGTLAFTSPDGTIARLAAADLAGTRTRSVLALEGGTAAWRSAGMPLGSGNERLADEPTDVWYRPYDKSDQIEAAMRDYLTWEMELPGQIERDGDAHFRLFR